MSCSSLKSDSRLVISNINSRINIQEIFGTECLHSVVRLVGNGNPVIRKNITRPRIGIISFFLIETKSRESCNSDVSVFISVLMFCS